MTFLFEDIFTCDTLYVNAPDLAEALDRFGSLKADDSSDFVDFHVYVRIM